MRVAERSARALVLIEERRRLLIIERPPIDDLSGAFREVERASFFFAARDIASIVRLKLLAETLRRSHRDAEKLIDLHLREGDVGGEARDSLGVGGKIVGVDLDQTVREIAQRVDVLGAGEASQRVGPCAVEPLRNADLGRYLGRR